MTTSSFENLGVCKEICETLVELGWKSATEIQTKAIPVALAGRDIVGLAETGSGKTGAFAIPILQTLIMKPRYNYALILTPTRELALQIKKHFMDLGDKFGLRVLCLVGGQYVEDQFRALRSIKHHIIIGTPGRICYHLENSKELILGKIRYLVLDEADQMLGGNFDTQLELILSKLPAKRKTYMYSATMTSSLDKIQTACLRMPVRLETSTKYTTVDKLDHAFVFLPEQKRDAYVAKLLTDLEDNLTSESRTIVFTATARESVRLGAMLKYLTSSDRVVVLNGLMRQDKRGTALEKFRSGDAGILVATDLASRGLDIPDVDLIVNYDVPTRPSWSESAKTYVHRVGRTARAGRPGRAITLVTPYSATHLKIIESALGSRIPQLPWSDPTQSNPGLSVTLNKALLHAKSVLRSNDKKQRKLNKKKAQKRKMPQDGQENLSAASMSESE